MAMTRERMEELGAIGVPEEQRPVVQITGQDGNAFNLVALVQQGLRSEGMRDKADELSSVYWGCQSYNELLHLLEEYADLR